MKISFCTTCMDRVHHLSQTLPHNLLNTASYPNREFIILNYGSRDGMHDWVKNNLVLWIEMGVVKYYRTQEPKFFSATHAKNVAHRQATGDILCNIDADNYIVPNFAEFLAQALRGHVVISSTGRDIEGRNGSCGKIAVRREHFYSVNGYDEEQNQGWGWDDTNFQYRVRMHNNLELVECDIQWNRCIDHSNAERVKNFPLKDIHESERLSKERLQRLAEAKDYVANKEKTWGYVSDLSIDIA